MTIRKGEDWGSQFVMAHDCSVVASDATAALLPPHSPFYVSHGDLFESLGQPRQPVAGESCQLLPIDAMQYTIRLSNGEEKSALAISSIAIGQWYRGSFFVLSNTGFYKSRHLLPRAHPNDGLLDLLSLSSSMTLRQRLLFNKKSRISAHVPHPDIRITRVATFTFTRSNANETLTVDGMKMRNWSEISVAIQPDYWHTVV